MTYRNDDGTPRREYRPAKTVFNKAALETFAGAPVTVNHPPQGKISADSWKRDAVGHLGDTVRQDGDHVVADMYIRDAATVAAGGAFSELAATNDEQVVIQMFPWHYVIVTDLSIDVTTAACEVYYEDRTP